MTAKSIAPKSRKTSTSARTFDAFLSHASQDAAFANTISAALTKERLKPWVDNSSLAFGSLLRDELQKAIGDSRVLTLLWSKPASESRWVTAEIFTAFHLDRFIIPCVLDDTPLPQFLQNTAYLTRQRDAADIGPKLARAIQSAPHAANKVAPWLGSRTSEIQSLIYDLGQAQIQTILAMDKNFDAAANANASIRSALESVMKIAPYDPMVLNLAGYQCKNDYMSRTGLRFRPEELPKTRSSFTASATFSTRSASIHPTQAH